MALLVGVGVGGEVCGRDEDFCLNRWTEIWVDSKVSKWQRPRESKRHQPGPTKDWTVGNFDVQRRTM